MSTDSQGQRTEQQTTATDAAGGKSEADRSVQGTDLRSGFAELRARATTLRDDAKAGAALAQSVKFTSQEHVARGIYAACAEFLLWLDAIEADAKSASTGS